MRLLWQPLLALLFICTSSLYAVTGTHDGPQSLCIAIDLPCMTAQVYHFDKGLSGYDDVYLHTSTYSSRDIIRLDGDRDTSRPDQVACHVPAWLVLGYIQKE